MIMDLMFRRFCCIAFAVILCAQPAPSRAQVGEPPAISRALLAVQAAETRLGPNHLEVANALNELGKVYQAMRRAADAEPVYRRSLEIRTARLGPDHALVAQSLNNIAEVYREQGRFGEAEPLYRRGMGIVEKAFG